MSFVIIVILYTKKTTLTKISDYIIDNTWIPAYFLYEFGVLNSTTCKYNHTDVHRLLIGRNTDGSPNYQIGTEYIELTDSNEKYNLYKLTNSG